MKREQNERPPLLEDDNNTLPSKIISVNLTSNNDKNTKKDNKKFQIIFKAIAGSLNTVSSIDIAKYFKNMNE